MRVNHKNLWVYCNSYILSILCEFILPWDRCYNYWIGLFTGSLQASFSVKFLSSQTRKKWRRLLVSADSYCLKYRSQCSGSENTAFAPTLDKGRVSLGCLSFLQQKIFSEVLCDLEGKSLLVNCKMLLFCYGICYSFFPHFPPHPNKH